ncbi:maleylacetoacetate isomerase [Xanthobacter dioxanivorans]|uniref:Maleylacetoacetate isomerase n=1 Tax=Xanthobacter dioxanivorans TaxID=2528964 RepID=A0A974PT50_9HYPH|nr:maleylacetoacetate isomerase [Xanthobacter dioxanivorans]QRG09061.1 maleylacetoacetate isomerase [Xanthobacter dioxanivorans]
MTFYGYFRSSAAYRCRIAFNLKGLAPPLASIHLRRGEQRAEAFRAVNPQALVPALVEDGTILTQSLAIIEWLEETHPEPPLLPRDRAARARARAFALAICCDIHPLQNLRVLDHLKRELGADQAALDAWCRRWIGDGLAACEALLAREREAPFAFGDGPGIAEICLIPQMFSADRFGVDLSGMPRLRRLRAACEALPAFADAHPARQPDAEAA